MKEVKLLRLDSGDQGTVGRLFSDRFAIGTLELPWRDNVPQKSCIPTGLYEVHWRFSQKFGWCYEVQGVPNRAGILFHAGNYAGDRLLGFRSHSYGCILPCRKFGLLDGQEAGLLSRPAVRDMNSYFASEPFLLEVIAPC